MSRQKLSLEEKMHNENPEFAAEVKNLSTDKLKKRLAELAEGAQQVEDSKEADNDLTLAKNKASELGAPYRDAKKAIKLKMKYLIQLIKGEPK